MTFIENWVRIGSSLSRYETLKLPDIILGNDFRRVGILKNPTIPNSNTEILSQNIVVVLV